MGEPDDREVREAADDHQQVHREDGAHEGYASSVVVPAAGSAYSIP
jgi:hypothetical protein